MKPWLVLCTLLLVNDATGAQPPLVFTSSDTQTTLIELFTSEGCSSCPPADRWISRLKGDHRLWRDIIPLAFHVDYWNYLGWTDRFSKPVYSARQRRYAHHGYARTVYTPGFFVNGREWRGWFTMPKLDTASANAAGTLTVTIDPQAITAVFHSAHPVSSTLHLHIALLGFDINTQVRNGENSGKTLTHDFVVLALHTQAGRSEQQESRWRLSREQFDLSQPYAKGIAIWVSAGDDPTPLQATGGWLNL